MKKLLLFLLLLPGILPAQQTATKIAGFNAYVYTPPGYSKAAKYPVLIAVPGNGEVGTNISLLNTYLPCKFIASGTLAPQMIIICVQPPGQWPSVGWLKLIYDSVVARWSINTAQVYGTGYSAGATVWDAFATTPGYSKLVTAVFSMSAPPMNSVQSDAPLYKTFALSGGHFLGLSGTADLTTGYDVFANIMNLSAPGSGFYTYITGMGHGGWDAYYNPGFSFNGLTVYNWLLQWGQAILPNKLPVANAGPAINITLPVNSVTLDCSGSSDSDGSISSCIWTVLNGPNSPAFSGATMSGLIVGTYTVQLTVIDNQGGTSSAKTTVTVNPIPKTIVFSINLVDGKKFTLYSDGSYTLQ